MMIHQKVLVFATHNLHKATEIQQLVGNTITIKTLTDIGCNEEIAETGKTLQENASIKSSYVFENYGLNCFADDSGLQVMALGNEPGVYSARYAGPQKNDGDNMDLLLSKLEHFTNRSAFFSTVISLQLNGEEYFFEGKLEGEITKSKKGTNGFGYDPIFKPDGYNFTLAEFKLTEKNNISHRAKATLQLIAFLKTQI